MKTKYTVTSSKIKSALVCHLRFERQILCVSEYSPVTLRDKEDVASLYSNNDGIKQLDVYEIKISYSDFKNDFRKQKHRKMPYSRFIYVVEPHMIQKCEEFLKEHYPSYGLMSFEYNPTYKKITGFKTIIRAKSDNKSIDKDDEKAFYQRMSSMAAQSLQKEERIEFLLEQLNIFRQDAEQSYLKYSRECKNDECTDLKRNLRDVLNTVLSFEEVLSGSMDLPHAYQNLLEKKTLKLNEIRDIFDYCKGFKDYKKLENNLIASI